MQYNAMEYSVVFVVVICELCFCVSEYYIVL